MSGIAIEVARDGGDRDGGEIRDALIGASLPAAIARGRAELDAHHRPRDRIELSLDYRADIDCGDLVQITEPEGGAHWRGIVIGVSHAWDGATASTQLSISRPREASA